MSVISITNLCKSYGGNAVLHDVNLEIQPGKLVGFLGPNGAGKTTTIRILLGLLAADSGGTFLFGKPVHLNGKSLRSKIGYLPGDVHFYSNISGRATLRFMAAARKRNCNSEIERLAQSFELELDKTVRKYSTGMRQKLGLIQAFMHRPQLLILDEPTSALDPLVRTKVFDELRGVIADGRSVLFSSHSLNEVEELCDEVVILRGGQIVEHQEIEVLRKRALRRISISFADLQSIPSDVPSNFRAVERKGNELRGTWTGNIDQLLSWIAAFQIADLIVERPDLNDLFITYYSNSKAGVDNASEAAGEDV